MLNDTAAHLGLFISNLNISCLQNRSLVSRIKTSSPESKLRFQNRSFFYGIESLCFQIAIPITIRSFILRIET